MADVSAIKWTSLLPMGTPGAIAARKATSTVPIVACGAERPGPHRASPPVWRGLGAI